jgi:cell division septum initiation protein DivIVA
MAPETQNAADLHVVPPASADEPREALGLLGHARRVADETLSQANAEAEQVLGAAREEAQRLQRESRERAEHELAEADRKAQTIRHEAVGDAERELAGARAEVVELQQTLSRLHAERTAAVESVRSVAAKLMQAADSGGVATDAHQG